MMKVREFLKELDEYGLLDQRITVDDDYCSEDMLIFLNGLGMALEDEF